MKGHQGLDAFLTNGCFVLEFFSQISSRYAFQRNSHARLDCELDAYYLAYLAGRILFKRVAGFVISGSLYISKTRAVQSRMHCALVL